MTGQKTLVINTLHHHIHQHSHNMQGTVIILLAISLPSLLATFGYGGKVWRVMYCLTLSLCAQGHGGGHGSGTACIVKGSYCQCHYCKCEKGHVSCKGYGHEKGYGEGEVE